MHELIPIFCRQILWYGLCFLLSIADWKKKKVEIWQLFLLVILAVYNAFQLQCSPDITWFSWLMLTMIISQHYIDKKLMGEGDWIFLFAMAYRLPITRIPLFLALSGGFGLFIFFIQKQEKISFIPAMFLSSIVCELCTKF